MPLAQALQVAREHNLDLVEVATNVAPPVCRLLDWGKFKYEQTKKEREARKSHKVPLLREVRVRVKIGDHDLEAKIRLTKKLLGEGDKVKVSVLFRGREITHPELGKDILQKMLNSLKGVAAIDKPLAMEARRMSLILSPLPSKQPKEMGREDAKD